MSSFEEYKMCYNNVMSSNDNTLINGPGRRPQNFVSFEEARAFARKLNLKSVRAWLDYVKAGLKPDNIPANPAAYYEGKGWRGMPDFLDYTPKKSGRPRGSKTKKQTPLN